MKDKKLKPELKLKQALGILVSLQLALSVSPIAALAESTDSTINNTSIPLAQPAPSQMVQRIWSTLDLRKLRKKEADKQETKATATETSQKTASKTESTSVAETLQTTDGQVLGSRIVPEENSGAGNAEETKDKVIQSTAAQETAQSPEGDSSASSSAVTAGLANESPGQASPAAPALNEKPAAADEITSSSETKSDKPIAVASNLISLPPGSVLGRIKAESDRECLVVDNDEAEEIQEEGLAQEEMPTDDGKTHVKSGARFPVVIQSQITSKTAKKGDPIQARLKYDLKIGDRLVATKGAVVTGHVNYVLKARTILHSLVSPERWYRNSGCVGLAFDEIINEKGEHLPLVAQPSRQARIVKNKAEGRELGVNHYGQVTGPWAVQLRHKAIRIGLNAALAPAGVFSFGAMPVALGVLGAANPSFAFSKPVGLNVRHRRIKGFAWGFLSGIPGSWLIEDTTVRGQEAIIKPGDEFYVEIVQEFTGEPASDAQLMPGANTKLHGQILSDTSKKGKNAKNKGKK